MLFNNIFKYGSKSSIMIYANSDISIGNYTFKKGEPYTLLEDVEIKFYSNAENKTIKNAAGNQLSYSDFYPDSLVISNVPLTSKIMALIWEMKSNIKNWMFKKEILNIQNGIGYLSQSDAKDIYIYDLDKILIHTIPLSEDGKIELELDGDFLVIYQYAVESKTFSMNKKVLPYLRLKIQGLGNDIDNTNCNVCLDLIGSLQADMDLDFSNESLNTIDLRFSIINADENKLFFS